ncbi:MAG TPA: diaminopimelate epimerase [Sedimenticola thiotaurini]|uniref:Diaminopimelate epimerase n=1 Tax=Sedimenticola thiotaurini TaxID=1543721 RepID=A0A831RIR1_9GAMM|nr:diaminopimelate epimerase [Sedimenticola thiotaurini]
MQLEFVKMHGLGNDFVVFDATRQPLELGPEQCRRIADRHFGIGCDQILLVEPPQFEGADFHYRIFNADGSEVAQCGNGARCFARFVRDQGLTTKETIKVGTHSGLITLYVQPDGDVRVDMGRPQTAPERIPFEADRQRPEYPIEVDGETLRIGAVSMGNPHAVLRVAEVERAPVARLGPLLERHPRFPERVNVGFMAIRSPREIDLRVFERGTGETLACGSGACAAVVVGRLQGVLEERVVVHLRGGDLVIEWQGGDQPVWMSGPAARVFEGKIAL